MSEKERLTPVDVSLPDDVILSVRNVSKRFTSKGVCVRALAHDIGAALGCGACLESLRRVKCGPFDVTDAISFMDLLKLDAVGFRARVVRPGGVYAK